MNKKEVVWLPDMQVNPYMYNPYQSPGYQMLNPYSAVQSQPNPYQQHMINQQWAQNQQNQQNQQQQHPNQTNQGQTLVQMKGRPVTGIEEAKAAQIDLDGSLHVFTDVGNGRIYTKQLGMNGIPVFNIYQLQLEPELPAVADNSGLMKRIELLEERISKYEGVVNSAVQPNADNRNASTNRKSSASSSTPVTEQS